MRKCQICEKPYEPRNSFQKVCWGSECSLAYVRQQREKEHQRAVKKAERESRKALREAKAKIETVTQAASKAIADVNRYVMAKARAEGLPCISCGSPNITEAGHYFHAGSKYRTSPLRFDLRNINAQCNQCNQHAGGGNQHEYQLGYIARFGQEAFDDLCELKRRVDCGDIPDFTKEQIREIAKQHRRMTCDLVKAEQQRAA